MTSYFQAGGQDVISRKSLRLPHFAWGWNLAGLFFKQICMKSGFWRDVIVSTWHITLLAAAYATASA